MAILDVNEARSLFDHVCSPPAGCGAIRRGLRLDPTAGDLTLWREQGGDGAQASGEVTALLVRRCPCGAQESLNPNIPAWEAQERDPQTGALIPHPGSLVGTELQTTARTTAVVSEHSHGYLPEPSHVAAARLIRRMQRHPALSGHAPLVEQRPARYQALVARLTVSRAAEAAAEQAALLPGEDPAQLTGPAIPASPPAAGTPRAAPGAAAPPSSPTP